MAPPRDVAVLAAALVQPALQAIAAPFPRSQHSTIPPPRSWFLGEPALAAGVAWPELRGKRLDFLACLDLGEVAATMPLDWLPSTGSLSFFYDLDKQPGGFDPKDRGSWVVVYRPDSAPAPSLASRAMSFRAIRTYPPADRPEPEALGLSEDEWDIYCGLELAQTGVEYYHQVGGFPQLIQTDDLELSAQLTSNGVTCSANGIGSARGKELSAGAADWRVLLQIASDKSLGFVWGDAGNLYFMIRTQDARAGRFDNVWLTSQCF